MWFKIQIILLLSISINTLAQNKEVDAILEREKKLNATTRISEKIEYNNLLSADYLEIDSALSMFYLNQAYLLSRKINDFYGIFYYHNLLADRYLNIERRYSDCIQESILGAKFALLSNDTANYLESIVRQSVALFSIKQYDSLINVCNRVVNMQVSAANEFRKGKLYTMMGTAYSAKKSPLAAIYLKQAIRSIETVKDNKFLISAYSGLMKYYLSVSKQDSALKYAKLAVDFSSNRNKNEIDYIHSASVLYTLLQLNGKKNEANIINDSILAAARNLKLNDRSHNKRVIQVQLLEKKSTLELVKRTKLVAGLILFCLLSAIMLYYYLKLKHKRVELESLNIELNKLVDRNHLLLKEIDHRTRNNFQVILGLLYLQRDSADEKTSGEILKKITAHLETVSRVNDLLHFRQDTGTIEVAPYLNWLVDNLIQNFNIHNKQIQFIYADNKLELDVNHLVPIGLIINELVINTMKHAFPTMDKGYIKIDLFAKDDLIYLYYEDNGVGSDNLVVAEGNIGIVLIESLVKQLRGQLKIDAKNGFKVAISFSH